MPELQTCSVKANYQQRKRKRVKSVPREREQKKRRTSRKRGGRAELLNLPFDVLLEIFQHLAPYDLLMLARTTKALRQLLLSRRSLLYVWKTALERVPGLPPCPPGMSEPAYANLVFSRHCHFCNATTTCKVEWRLRTRLCSICSRKHLRHLSTVRGWSGVSREHLSLLIPTKLGCLHGKLLYLPSSLQGFRNRYLALPKSDHASFLKKQRRIIQETIEHAQLCESWERKKDEERKLESSRLREERRSAIFHKLQELGWGEDASSIDLFTHVVKPNTVDRPQRLTEKIWWNIQDDILKFMQTIREKRLQREYEALLIKRKQLALQSLKVFKKTSLHEAQIMPEGPDFCNIDFVKDILHQPIEVEVTANDFESILALLPSAITQWREGLKRALLKVIETSSRPDIQFNYDPKTYESDVKLAESTTEVSLSNLDLATTIFRCKVCPGKSFRSVLLFYPQVYGHRCLTRGMHRTADYSLRLNGNTVSERVPWNAGPLVVDHVATGVTKDVLALLGLDPLMATTSDLDRLYLRLICQLCVKEFTDKPLDHRRKPSTPFVPLLTWRTAVNHHIDCHIGTPTSFCVLSKQSEELEANESIHREMHWRVGRCLPCQDTPKEIGCMSLVEVKAHCFLSHGVSLAVPDEDYFKDFAALDIEAQQLPFDVTVMMDKVWEYVN